MREESMDINQRAFLDNQAAAIRELYEASKE